MVSLIDTLNQAYFLWDVKRYDVATFLILFTKLTLALAPIPFAKVVATCTSPVNIYQHSKLDRAAPISIHPSTYSYNYPEIPSFKTALY